MIPREKIHLARKYLYLAMRRVNGCRRLPIEEKEKVGMVRVRIKDALLILEEIRDFLDSPAGSEWEE